MRVSKTAGWVLGLGLAACVPGTKSGGLILGETDSDGSDDESDDGDATGAAAACHAEPVCGNGVVEALEECDGSDGCDACSSAATPTVLTQGGGIGAIAFAPDGSWLATTQELEGAPLFVRRYDAAGVELWSHELLVRADSGGDVLLDAGGTAYVASGISTSPEQPTHPWVGAWDPAGVPLWSVEGPDPGHFVGITVAGDRIAAIGADTVDDEASSLIRVFDASGAEQWSLGDDSLAWLTGAAFVGDELVVAGNRDGEIDDDAGYLRRYDDLATMLWSLELPNQDGLPRPAWGVIADRAGGTWTSGWSNAAPYAVRHDRDGNELEVLDCFGDDVGGVSQMAIYGEDRLALAIGYQDGEGGYLAWFATVEAGEVVSATTFTSSTRSAHALGVGWRGEQLMMGWTDGGSSGVPGQSTVLLSP
jgi:hypothetical protein